MSLLNLLLSLFLVALFLYFSFLGPSKLFNCACAFAHIQLLMTLKSPTDPGIEHISLLGHHIRPLVGPFLVTHNLRDLYLLQEDLRYGTYVLHLYLCECIYRKRRLCLVTVFEN